MRALARLLAAAALEAAAPAAPAARLAAQAVPAASPRPAADAATAPAPAPEPRPALALPPAVFAPPLTPVAGTALPADAPREARWREDLRVLATELPRLHRNAWARLRPARLAAEAAALDSAIPRLTDGEVRLRLLRLTALLRDGHTSVAGLLASYPTRLPLALHSMDDGLWILGADSAHAALVGTRVVEVAGRPIAAAVDSLRPWITHENAMGLRQALPRWLVTPGALRDAGLVPDADSVALTVEDATGRRTRAVVAARPAGEVALVPPAAPPPLYRQRAGEKYWLAWLPAQGTVYVKYDQCRDPDDFRALVDSVTRLLDGQPARRLVVDLRNNAGGNSEVVRPLVAAVRARPAIDRRDALYVVIGRQTFSSGYLAALRFRGETRATLVGEPIGERPNHYGEVRRFALPNSGLPIWYSTKHFRALPGDPETFAPDVHVPLTAAAALAGRDPVLEWILARPAPARPAVR